MMDDDEESVHSGASENRSVAKYSTASGAGGPSGSSSSVSKLVGRIHAMLAHDRAIATKDHMRAASYLAQLQAHFRPDEAVHQNTQIKLICVVTSLLRRISKMQAALEVTVVEGNEASFVDSPDDFVGTMTLAFVSVAIADVMARGGVPVAPDAAVVELRTALGRSSWSELSRISHKRRADPGEEIDELERQRMLMEEVVERKFVVSEDSSQWSAVIHQPGNTAGAALRVAGGMVAGASKADLPRFRELAFLFARSTIAQMQTQVLRSSDDRDFLTLSASRLFSDFMSPQALSRDDESLNTIISAGESEAGQACLRDLVTSFLLPKEVVGVRRTLLLPRETSERVSLEYPWIAAAAHETAMMGCESVWTSSTSELKKACALLAGFAMFTTFGSGDDKIRKATAFNGTVQLPFFECPLPEWPSNARPPKLLALVPTTRSWVVYTLTPAGQPSVELCKRGLDGLCHALLLRWSPS